MNTMAEHHNSHSENFKVLTLMDKYPGIENTEIFEVLQDCMINRKPDRLEIEFVFPNHSTRWFDISIIAVEEGICIMSLDITIHKENEEKFSKSNRLYAFMSQVSQNIVRVSDETTLFHNACDIAVTYGNFEMAWIGLFDYDKKTINMVDHFGIPDEKIDVFINMPYLEDDSQLTVLSTETHFICDDIENSSSIMAWRAFALERNLQSCIVLPIRKSGSIIGTFNLYSSQMNFFNKEETNLLEEVTEDISFALDLFEKAKRHDVAKTQIIKNERRFRALIEKSADIKTLSSLDGKVIYASPSIKKVLGYSPKEFKLLPFFAVFHPDDIPVIIRLRKRLLLTPGKSMSRQLRLLHKSGRWVWCEGTITNMLHEEGIEALVSNFSDISERKTTAQQREFDRNNLNALINNTNDLMWSVDTNFNLITANNPFNKMILLASGKEIQNKCNVVDLEGFPKEELYRYKKFYERAFLGETFTQIEHRAEPVEIWSEISFYPIRKDKEIVGTACYSHDITNRKIAELKLEKQNKELIKTNLELDRLVYSVSHDLRSPLTSILGLISFIEEDSLEKDTLNHVKMIKSNIERLDCSIKNILNYSQNNRTELDIRKISIQKTITQIIDLLRNGKHSRDILFEVNIQEEADFYSDISRFNTIVENLVSNAIKHHSNAVTGRFIKISGHSTEKSFVLMVEDNGIGIARDNHERIFEMFYRISGKTPGSGIGLYILKETVEKLQGTVTVKSEQGIGATFTVTLKNLM